MFNNPSLGYAPIDPNTQRALVELATVISDVESRIQAVKFGLAQTFPHLAPQLASRAPIGLPTGFPTIGASPFVPQFASPYGPVGNVGSPLPTSWPAVSPFGVGVPTPYGVPPMGASPFLPTLPFGTFRY